MNRRDPEHSSVWTWFRAARRLGSSRTSSETSNSSESYVSPWLSSNDKLSADLAGLRAEAALLRHSIESLVSMLDERMPTRNDLEKWVVWLSSSKGR